MVVKQDSVIYNTKHIKEMAAQIRNNDDCDTLKTIIKTYMDIQLASLEAIIKKQLQILEDFFPILKFPKSLKEVIDWIGHLILGTAYEQVKAYANYVISLVLLAEAIAELAVAIAEVGPRIAACAIEIEQNSLREIQGKLDGLITDGLASLQVAQDKMVAVVGQIDPSVVLSQYSTTDPTSFVKSISDNAGSLDAQINAVKASGASMTPPDTVSTVNQNVTALDGSILSITNGLVTKVTPP
jgi:hypothetical protein